MEPKDNPITDPRNILLRRGRPEDASAVTDLVRKAYGKWIPRIGRKPHPMTVDQARAIAEHELWVAEADGGAIAAVLDLVYGDDYIMIENLATHPAHQGEGLGLRLLVLAEDRAREADRSTIRLYTHEKMTENVAFYRARGFAVSERRELDGFKRVFMEKTVTR